MRNGSNIFDVIKRLPLLVAGHPTQRVTRVNTLEDTETSKIFDGELQHFDASRPTYEACFQTGMFFLLLLSHARQLALGTGRRTQGGLDGLLLRAALDAIPHDSMLFLLYITGWILFFPVAFVGAGSRFVVRQRILELDERHFPSGGKVKSTRGIENLNGPLNQVMTHWKVTNGFCQ